MRHIDLDGVIAAIDSMHEGAAELHWAEAEQLSLALGWPEGSDDQPDGTWIRAALNDLLRR